MKPRPFAASLITTAILLHVATIASAEPKPAKPNNQHSLQQRAAARQHLLKAHENFAKLHLLEQAKRPLPAAPPEGYEYGAKMPSTEFGAKIPTYEYGSKATPVTVIQRD